MAAIAAGVLAAAGLAETLTAQTAQGQGPTVVRPQSARRLVRLFDFEEPNNPYQVPDHWYHAQDEPGGVRRPGFPQDNEAVFDFTTASSGKASVRLPTHGGSTSLRLKAGEIPIFPNADYTISAKVRTVDLEYARGFLTARFLDQRLMPIPGSEVRSEPVLAPGGWQTVRIVVTGASPEAAWLQIDLEVLQPKLFEPKPPDAIAMFIVPHEDVAGAAYFDDVAVALVPRTRFWAEQPSGMFIAPERPTLEMVARDQGGEDLHARVRVLDMDDRVVASESFKLDPSARATMWTPNLPGFGWYRAVMEIDAADVSVTRQEVWICSMPERAKLAGSAIRAADLFRFGIIAESTPEDVLSQMPAIAERARTKFIVIPAFDASVPAEGARAALAARGSTIEKLLTQGQQITLALDNAPPALAESLVLDSTDALGLCEQDPKLWSPWLEPTLDVYGQRVVRYQLGNVFDTHALRRNPTAGLEGFERVVSRLVPGPRFALPWRADHPLPFVVRSTGSGGAKPGAPARSGALVRDLAVVFPLGFAPSAMVELGAAWREQIGAGNPMELTVVPELPDMERYGARARVVEAARRTVEFWNALGSGSGLSETPDGARTPLARIAVGAPWSIAEHAGERTLLPGPALAVMTQMAERLAGRRVIATVPAPAGVRALLLAEHAGGGGGQTDDGSGRPGDALVRACVIAWNESAEPARAWVDVYPARDGVDVADVFGNTSRVSPAANISTPGAGVQVRVPLTDAPVVIEGVDPYLAQFTSSFRLTPHFIPAIASDHEVRISMTNPWPIRITGRLQLEEAAGGGAGAQGIRSAPWTFSPNIVEFAVAPGQTVLLPITVSLGPGQLAGAKDLAIVTRVLADKQYQAIRSNASVEVGLPDLELVPEVQLGPTPTGPDVIVVAAVTNRDSRPRSLRVEITAKDTPSQQLPISSLAPSETIFKRFVIRDGAKLLAGKHIRVTLGDDETAARLSKAALVPDLR